MNIIVDQNEVCRKYDYSSLITAEENASAISDIQSVIDAGNYFKNSPPFQTNQNLFQRSEPIWLKLRMTFLASVFMYLGKEHKVSNMMAWSFMTNQQTQVNRDNQWHHHEKHHWTSISGIMYLHIPDDVKDFDTCGTEMAPNGPEGPGKFFIRPSYYTWLIYPSKLWHRPGIAQSDKHRFILAADVEYQ